MHRESHLCTVTEGKNWASVPRTNLVSKAAIRKKAPIDNNGRSDGLSLAYSTLLTSLDKIQFSLQGDNRKCFKEENLDSSFNMNIMAT